jgi:hypothetical protein
MMGRTVVVHGSQLTDQVTLEIKNCPVCGIRYAAPSAFFAIKDRDAGGWHCPNGHSLVFIEAEPARLKKELTRTRAQLDQARADANRQRNLAEHRERSNRALRGHLTRWRKRVANGVCPVAGCHRHFPNVQAHVSTEHPDWITAHPEVFEVEP